MRKIVPFLQACLFIAFIYTASLCPIFNKTERTRDVVNRKQDYVIFIKRKGDVKITITDNHAYTYLLRIGQVPTAAKIFISVYRETVRCQVVEFVTSCDVFL